MTKVLPSAGLITRGLTKPQVLTTQLPLNVTMYRSSLSTDNVTSCIVARWSCLHLLVDYSETGVGQCCARSWSDWAWLHLQFFTLSTRLRTALDKGRALLHQETLNRQRS